MTAVGARPLEPKQHRSAETRRRLLDAAIEELLENGHAGLNTHSVALRAGITRGAQQHHFPRKDLLVGEAVRHLTERQLAELGAAVAAVPKGRARLHRALDVIYEQYGGPLFAASLELSLAAQHEPNLRSIVAEHERELARSLGALAADVIGQARYNETKFAQPWAMAFGTARGIALLKLLGHPPELVDRQWAFARTELLRILTAAGARAIRG
jgi:AcrR family transcriptional regulator